ncbi:MAG: SEL1-like repeat protein [Bacteroidota bacterium]|nr:MAG: SEL1-like repeat protein [Bacteroidota bacterium]
MAAEQGDADAQYSVGMMHLFGDVGQPNYEQAADYLERAAAQRSSTIHLLFGNQGV